MKKKAKKKMLSTQNNKTGAALPKSDKLEIPIHTIDELARLANVGHTAYHQAKTILDSDNEEVKQKVLSGDLSINAGEVTKITTYLKFEGA